MVKETKRPKPTTIDVAGELGFTQQKLPDIGPGSHKPQRGRGGVALPADYYSKTDDLVIPEKKGIGIGERVKAERAKNATPEKPKWSDLV